MRAMLDVVNQNQIFHRGRIGLLLLHLSHHIWTSGPSKVIQYLLTTFTTTFFSSSNSERWNENMEQCKRIRKAFQFYCYRWILRFEGHCVQRRCRKVRYFQHISTVALEFKILFRFEPIIKVGECFTISNGVLKNKNAQYNNTGSDYELTLGRSSIIEPCDGDDE